MAEIRNAFAFCNNEVAFLVWDLDTETLPGCLGFDIVRELLDANDKVVEAKPLAAYVAFKGQSNPDWLNQNTTVWPVQKFNWRDLTLRRRRDGSGLRPEQERVRYVIRAVGRMREGLEPVEVVAESHVDRKTRKRIPHTYKGTPIPLGYLTPAARTNIVQAGEDIKPFRSTFTNGILSTQFLINVLKEDDGEVKSGELERHLKKPGDWLRNYLSGDVLVLMKKFFADETSSFLAALYEFSDEELTALVEANAQRIRLILSDAGSTDHKGADGKTVTTYDTTNAKTRAKLAAIADKPGSKFTLQNRLFNGSGHIGHNKFVVRLDAAGTPRAVLTGSTNWTFTGVAGQSNNCIVINDDAIAADYAAYWQRLADDVQPEPDPTSARAKGAGQKDPLKTANAELHVATRDGYTMTTAFSPNVPGHMQPPSKNAKKPSAPPPDMARLFSLMRQAKHAIFFLVFLPSRGGLTSIISEAVALGEKDPTLTVLGAISDSQAMWGYEASDSETGEDASSPHVYQHNGISVIRASALADREMLRDIGDFKLAETLTVGKAIIHDKILVIDPADPEHCVVAFGSHNLGYKASYANDENLVIVEGHRDLALAYTAHVLDVYDHYRFRAVEIAKEHEEKGAPKGKKWSGFLDVTDAWQSKVSRRLSSYFGTGG